MATGYHGKNERYLTIGYGHYGPDVRSGQTITEEEAKQLLAKDAAHDKQYSNAGQNTARATEGIAKQAQPALAKSG